MKQENLRAILENIVDRQLLYNDPPEAFNAYERLVKEEAFSDEEARSLISRTIKVELFRLMRYAEPFNRKRFVRNLEKLPDLPNVD